MSYDNPWMKQRKIRLQQLREIIREAKEIEHKKLVGVVLWDMGIREKTLNDYLDLLQKAEMVKWDVNRKLWMPT